MTFTEIVDTVMERADLSSAQARARVGKNVNQYYKRVTSMLGVNTSTRQSFEVSTTATIGSAEVTFASCEKITRVYYLSGSDKVFLDEVTVDEIQEENLESSDTPTRWAVKAYGGTSVTVLLDAEAATGYTIYADGYATVSTLVGESVPVIPESFHGVLVEGPLTEEYMIKREPDLTRAAEAAYERHLSRLRLWMATSAYRRVQQSGR